MKKLAIFCVTYHSYKELKLYLTSIDKAASKVVESLSVDVFIADNTETDFRQIDYLDKFYYIKCLIFPFYKNMGYFGGIQQVMKSVDLSSYNFVALTNVDLTLSDDAFLNLCKIDVEDNVGWIAVSILSQKELRDRNPSILYRYSKSKLKLLKLKFDFPILDFIYNNTLYKRKKFLKKYRKMDIYAGHGSFILLTKKYFEQCGIIDYPVFLFGEELYLAEECRKHALRVVYCPDIIVYDSEHVSTSKLKDCNPFKKNFYYQCNSEAINFILSKYY